MKLRLVRQLASLVILALVPAFDVRASQAQISTPRSPEQLRIAFGDDPTTTMRVVWQTKAPTPRQVVEYGVTRTLGKAAEGIRPTYAYETGAIAEVTLTGLDPGTTYFYRAGDPDGGWSEVRSFRTAPRAPREFTFTAFGDQGVSRDAETNVRNIVAENPAFHLLLGDLSYANGTQPIWDDYLRQIEPMTSRIPYMPTLGNHENERITVNGTQTRIGYMSYLARFALPGNEQWYHFDVGPARFVAFNSDDYLNPAQMEWLERTLSSARSSREIKWVIVFQHHPLYGTSIGRNNNFGLIRALQPVFDRYKVDLVLTGHDHNYERQFPLREGKVTSYQTTGYRKGEGTLYVKHGGGGKSHYFFSDPMPDICAVRERVSGYLRITVRRSGPLTIEARRVDRSLIEKIEIRD